MIVGLISFLPAHAQEQVVDLSATDFSQSDLYPLGGRWEFYWNQLLTPQDFATQQIPTTTLAVPYGWSRGNGYPARGVATYRLRVKLPPHNNGLALYFSMVNSAARIWINGEKVAESGVVSADENRYQARLGNTIVEIPTNSSSVEIVVQAANFTYFNGGISGIPQIGKIGVLLARLNKAQGVENFFAGSLVAMFIYQLILFFLFKRGKPYLWLSLICLGVALRAMIVHGGSFLLPNLFPSVSLEVWKKIEFGSVYSIAAFFPLYVFHLFREVAPKWPIRIFVAIASLLCLAVVLLPQYQYGELLDVSHGTLLLGFVYAVYTITRAWKNGSKDAKVILFGVLASFPFILIEIVKNSILFPLNVQFMYMVEVGVLVFLLFQVYLLANHFAASYFNLEQLNLNLERIVEERSGELITANRVKDRLLSVISHDIKSPLNSLKGILNIFNKGSISQEEFKNYARKIEDDLSKTSLLVDNMLYWTASQLKGTTIKKERFNLGDLIEENVELFHSMASNKRIVLKNELTDEHVIYFDRDVLNLVLRNMIANAIKFSHEGDEVQIHSTTSGNTTLVQVIDYGIGMTNETMRSVQHSFSVKSKSGTNDEKGTGLGLAFCRDYLLKAGGEIKMDSTPGKGSTFTIVIPESV